MTQFCFYDVDAKLSRPRWHYYVLDGKCTKFWQNSSGFGYGDVKITATEISDNCKEMPLCPMNELDALTPVLCIIVLLVLILTWFGAYSIFKINKR